ncbi:MAG: hypothetical protein ACYC3X_24495 [Pirellulaceae bacterium]
MGKIQQIVVSWIGNQVHQDRERENRAFRVLTDAVQEKLGEPTESRSEP